MKVVKRPPTFEAHQFLGKERFHIGIHRTWPAAGKEPEGVVPFDQEQPRRQHSHTIIWELHRQGVGFWVTDLATGMPVGVRIGEWIIFRGGCVYEVLSDAKFRARYTRSDEAC